ncbi:hypothetical protein BJY59DRAFT_553138 [Rhodotorula toruloides]
MHVSDVEMSTWTRSGRRQLPWPARDLARGKWKCSRHRTSWGSQRPTTAASRQRQKYVVGHCSVSVGGETAWRGEHEELDVRPESKRTASTSFTRLVKVSGRLPSIATGVQTSMRTTGGLHRRSRLTLVPRSAMWGVSACPRPQSSATTSGSAVQRADTLHHTDDRQCRPAQPLLLPPTLLLGVRATCPVTQAGARGFT